MEIGMSLACLYPMEPERVVPEVSALNIKICEVFLNTASELEEGYLHSLRETCNRQGIRVYSIHPFTSIMENYLFFSPYPRRIADAVHFYRRYADAAKILGAKVVNMHGDRWLGLDSLSDFADCLAPVMALQRETGICFAQENVFYNSVNHPEFTARLRQRIPEVRFTFDIKQAFKGGQDACALAEAMGDAMVNFHMNDRDETHLCMLPGQGTVDFDRIAGILSENHYAFPGLIEVYRKNFSDPREIMEAKKFLEGKFMLAK